MAFHKQLADINICVLFNKPPSETLELLIQPYEEEPMKKSQVYVWHKRFCEGRESTEDGPRSGRPSTPVNDKH